MLTGDSQAEEMREAMQNLSGTVDVLQVPHHGSVTGLAEDIIDTIHPKLAVISVEKYNKYGHPTEKTLTLLKTAGIKMLRTGNNGEIEMVTDGNTWNVSTYN